MNRADYRAIANRRAAARGRLSPLPELSLDDLSAWLRRRASGHVIAMLKERDKQQKPTPKKPPPPASSRRQKADYDRRLRTNVKTPARVRQVERAYLRWVS